MSISRKLIYIVSGIFLALIVVTVSASISTTPRIRTLTLEDLPKDAVPVAHVHSEAEIRLDENGEPIGEMEHYATPEAIKNGGPIYGIYGYRILSIEYEIPESRIGVRMVGREFPGWGLAPSFFGLVDSVPSHDHFHVGLKDAEHGGIATEKVYRIHFMFLPHEEELAIGLSCG